MIDWFASGGFFMWPVLLAGLVVVGLAIDALRKVLATEGNRDPRRVLGRIDAVLFWGGFAALVGVLGTLGGIAQVAGVLQRSGGAPAELVWGGIGNTLTTMILGLAVLLLALAIWFGLRTAHRNVARA